MEAPINPEQQTSTVSWEFVGPIVDVNGSTVRIQTTQQTSKIQRYMVTLLWKQNMQVGIGNFRESPRNKHNFFINMSKMPHNRYRDVTYGCIVCDYREGNSEPN